MSILLKLIRLIGVVSSFVIVILNDSIAQQNDHSINEKIISAEKLLNNKKANEALNLLTTTLNSNRELNINDSLGLFKTLGNCHFQLQHYADAIMYYEKSLAISNLNDTLRADIYSQIGMSKYRLSDYPMAMNNIIQARNLYRKIYGTNDLNYTRTLNTLGFLYNIQAKYSEAEKTFQEARQISFRLNGGEDIQYSRIINNLAIVYTHLNRYEKADELFKTSLRIKEKISGKQSKDYANTLYNLADFYSDLGRTEKAKSCIREGIEIFDTLKETSNPDYLKFLDYLAILTEKTGQLEEAKKLFNEALSRREKLSLTDRDDYALNLLNLGHLLFNLKEYQQAFPYIEKASGLIAKIYGKNHPTYAKVLVTLATIQSKQNENDNALKNYKTAIQIIQTTLGNENIENFKAQFSYALFLKKIGKKIEAIEILKKINKIPQSYLKRATRFLSEKELNDKIKSYLDFVHEIYSFANESPNDPDLTSMAYNTSLFYRGFILNSMQHIRLSMSNAQKVTNSRDEIISLHRQLENELNRPIAERSNTTEIEKLISEKEGELANKIGSMTEEESLVQWEDVRGALGEGEAAIEFINFPNSISGDSIFYGALLLKNNLENPIFINLCRESDLEAALMTNSGRTSDYITMLYDFSNRGATMIGVKKKTLNELVWMPIQNLLLGISKLYIVPDGLLHRVAFSAIPISLETVVSDSIELVYLSSTKQVIPNDQKIMAYSGMQALVVGGINYDSESNELVASRSSDQVNQWSYLPWAAKESQDVADIMNKGAYKVSYLKGFNASEKTVLDSLESKEGFRILHFATHGYFKGRKETEQNSIYYGSGLMNSALVFAGANNSKKLNNSNENEDGLLTAYTISKLDLSKTELVVLSACETALGDIHEVEGVYGMQRAFKLAGVNQLILSLWQIPDRETKDFMTSFYTNWLTNKSSVREAFNKTQTEFRKRFVNPYQWAGFVLVE